MPFPLGAVFDGEATNFALFSANAERVELCVFDERGEKEVERIELPEHTDQVWHGLISGLGPGTIYGYRVHGPYAPEAGHRFNANKLLLDPYARAHFGELQWDPAVFGYTIGSPDADLSFDTRDSAPFVPKSVVTDSVDIETERLPRRPRIPYEEAVIYETHVRGYTKLHPAVPEKMRGTYAGLAVKEVIDYIKSIGVTTVELLPIHSFLNDSHLLDRGLKNYWGYNTISYFVPDPRYASDQAHSLTEFRQMVAAMHDAGLEVILDVVYNHTAEGNELGATLCYKGIDNASYYRLLPDNPRYYINDTGTGNTVNVSNPRVMQMVTDSLRYWVQAMGIDGFRFDLGTILAREPEGFDPTNGFLNAVRQDPILSTVKLIAEPWDCGPGGYQVGAFPAGWAEWNDTFRDSVRDFWRTEALPSAIAGKLLGSPDQFNHSGRRAWASINFVTAHDGFTLNDLVSYNDRHNEKNGEDNRDGSDNNHSWNCGVEGPTDDPAILNLRARQMRNMLATLFLAKGTPMMLAGDEFGRTQLGNNNAYCQDSEISWVDWNYGERGALQRDFVAKLIGLRRKYAVVNSSRFLTSDADKEPGVGSVIWMDASGDRLSSEQWGDERMSCFGMLLDTNNKPSEDAADPDADDSLLFVFNAYHDLVQFTLPKERKGRRWLRVLDSNVPQATDTPNFESGKSYGVTGRSIVVFEQMPE